MPQEKGKWNKGHAKMPAALWQRVGDIAKELRIGDKRGRHNAIIMEIVSAAVAKWEYSPYVCRGARHLAFVTSQGDVFYQLVQDLKLNSVRKRLPCAVEMKLEKRDEYAREYAKLSGPEGFSARPQHLLLAKPRHAQRRLSCAGARVDVRAPRRPARRRPGGAEGPETY